VLTRADHPSGSDRLAEACELLALHDDEIVVNVQGDEPLIDPTLVDSVAALLEATPHAQMSTAAHRIDDLADAANTNVVKVVLDAQGMALYFSRATIPWSRDEFASGVHALPAMPLLRHVGIYGYRAGFLRRFPTMPQAPIEKAEALEQLRALWHGHRIAVHVTDSAPGIGVDTPADLQRVRMLFLDRG
jgi:3-deoxy-manno-octulosonate cytidylyltransferase (CMP-KDO synthetase)